MANNPFKSWTWFGKLWTWLFGSDSGTTEFVGNAPESSRGSGSGSTRPGSSNGRPDYSTDYGSSGQPLWESIGSEDSKGFFGSLGDPSTPIGNLISSLASRLTGAHLTGAEREANEFTANQAAINRQFESAEAEKARAWQEQQYLQYNSPAAQMRQFAEAGINPVMVAGGNMPAASTSTAAPSGSAGTSVSPSSPIDLVSGIISVLKAKSEIESVRLDNDIKRQDLLEKERSNRLGEEYDEPARIVDLSRKRQDLKNSKSENARIEAETLEKQIQNGITSEFGRLFSALSVAESLARIEQIEASKDLTEYERKVIGPLREALTRSESRKNNASAAAEEWANAYRRLHGADPYAPPVTQAFTSLIDWLNSNDRPKLRDERHKKQMQFRADQMID